MSAVQRLDFPVDKREVDRPDDLVQQMVGGDQLFDADELKLRLYTRMFFQYLETIKKLREIPRTFYLYLQSDYPRYREWIKPATPN